MSVLGHALVIGASGGIGAAMLQTLVASQGFAQVHGVSRTLPVHAIQGVKYHVINQQNDKAIATYCENLQHLKAQFSLVICCIGTLHSQSETTVDVRPEKRLEDLDAEVLHHYFHVNTVLPSLWLKHLEPLLKGDLPAFMVFLSARVGSIADNRLGGWYGYRASKAALNMLVKTAQVELHRRAKNVGLVSYHPGTVDSNLSKPFQANVKPDKLFTPQFTSTQLLSHLSDLQAQQGPYFIDWAGKAIPW